MHRIIRIGNPWGKFYVPDCVHGIFWSMRMKSKVEDGDRTHPLTDNANYNDARQTFPYLNSFFVGLLLPDAVMIIMMIRLTSDAREMHPSICLLMRWSNRYFSLWLVRFEVNWIWTWLRLYWFLTTTKSNVISSDRYHRLNKRYKNKWHTRIRIQTLKMMRIQWCPRSIPDSQLSGMC